ncbi:MarR family winged helix-turn-helix transcriptional regulator [Streptomyces sp. TLI_171]|uniref:MarR family winged helix-turn-helix transcriptional regulator n=1 Tax=Streptomyces sp. TLI_171 TaxID=1938859 RepID=UPI000C1997B4|nr:MarR family transcriptional regulator [Streptomyces sp. TLI_171]RKE20794.1 DNA-binding MarR family transcriptional regulator [Streptomyces sp. TLI_171]
MSAATDSTARADWRLGRLVRRLDQLLAAGKSEALRQFDLTVPQHSALAALAASGGMSGAQLARASGVTPQTMAVILGNLESKNLIERSPSAIHPKVLVTTLTREGKALMKKADARVQAVEDRLAEAYGVKEQEQLHALLERAIGQLEA